jgi:hypothetical protein
MQPMLAVAALAAVALGQCEEVGYHLTYNVYRGPEGCGVQFDCTRSVVIDHWGMEADLSSVQDLQLVAYESLDAGATWTSISEVTLSGQGPGGELHWTPFHQSIQLLVGRRYAFLLFHCGEAWARGTYTGSPGYTTSFGNFGVWAGGIEAGVRLASVCTTPVAPLLQAFGDIIMHAEFCLADCEEVGTAAGYTGLVSNAGRGVQFDCTTDTVLDAWAVDADPAAPDTLTFAVHESTDAGTTWRLVDASVRVGQGPGRALYYSEAARNLILVSGRRYAFVLYACGGATVFGTGPGSPGYTTSFGAIGAGAGGLSAAVAETGACTPSGSPGLVAGGDEIMFMRFCHARCPEVGTSLDHGDLGANRGVGVRFVCTEPTSIDGYGLDLTLASLENLDFVVYESSDGGVSWLRCFWSSELFQGPGRAIYGTVAPGGIILTPGREYAFMVCHVFGAELHGSAVGSPGYVMPFARFGLGAGGVAAGVRVGTPVPALLTSLDLYGDVIPHTRLCQVVNGCAGLCGDCNRDGIAPAVTDALEAARISVGLLAPIPQQTFCCDVNGDLQTTSTDALIMAQDAAGLPVSLDCR